MEQNYLKLIILFFDIGNSALRKFLEKKYQDAGHSCFTDLLEKEKHKLYQCWEPRNICCCKSNKESSKSMMVKQWNLLYEDSGGSSACRHRGKHPCKYIAKGDVRLEDLDFTLLRLIIDKLFPGNSDVENIRELRNNLIHSSAVSVEEDEFQRQWKSSKRSIFNLSKDSNCHFLTEIKQRVDQLATRTLDSGAYETLLKMIQQWKEDISTEMTSFKRKAESIENIVLSMRAKEESLESNMKSIATEVQSVKARVESVETNVQSIATDVQSMKADSSRQKDRNLKTSRHRCIERRIA